MLFRSNGNQYYVFFILTLNTLKEAKIQSLTFSLVNSCRVKVANKKPLKSSQSKSNKPKLFTPSQIILGDIVSYDPHQISPVNMTSRMVNLGNPRPNFSSALVSDYDPFPPKALIQSLLVTSSSSQPNTPKPVIISYKQKLAQK